LPAPEDPRAQLEDEFVAPRGVLEERVAGIWSEVLGVEVVGAHDNFFELGGNSLQATQVISRLRETFAVELLLRTLFEEPTVAGLAERVEAARQSNPVPSIATPGSDDHEEVRL
jgi:acyl carrier protein